MQTIFRQLDYRTASREQIYVRVMQVPKWTWTVEPFLALWNLSALSLPTTVDLKVVQCFVVTAWSMLFHATVLEFLQLMGF